MSAKAKLNGLTSQSSKSGSSFLEFAVFLTLVTIVALRPLISERYDSSVSAITAAISEISDATPLRTLIIDTIILACAAILFARRSGASVATASGIIVSWILFAVAGALSIWFAGQKRIAFNASLDWLSVLMLTLALSRTLTSEWRRRILLAAILASACAQAVQCIDQYFVGFEDTWQFYQERKTEFWAGQGVELDSPKVELFERRMQAREATGWLPHSNVTGSYLVLCGFAAIGATFSAGRKTRRSAQSTRASPGGERNHWHKNERLVAITLAVGQSIFVLAIFAAAALTFSTGAWVSAGLGAALWLVLTLGKRWIFPRRGLALITGCIAFVLGLAATVFYGLSTGGLPGSSLNFRWQYWLASAKLIADHLWFGVGRENFGRHYLQYKSIESSEEISNPHNLFIQMFAEQGIFGLLAIVVLLIVASRILTRPPSGGMPAPRRTCSDESATASFSPQSCSVDVPQTCLAGVVILGFLLFARSFLLGTTDPDFQKVAAVMVGLPWIIGFVVFAFLPGLPSRPVWNARSTTTGVAIGLFALLIHDMVNFAMFVPGVATTTFALLAYCIAGQNQSQPALDSRPVRQWIPFVLSGLALIATVTLGLLPVAMSQFHLSRARAGIDVEKNYLAAASSDLWDPTPYAEHAEWLLQTQRDLSSPKEILGQAMESIHRAIDRDPFNLRQYQVTLAIRQSLAGLTTEGQDLIAIEVAKKMIDLYPTDPMLHVALGDCYFRSYRKSGGLKKLTAAVKSYQKALSLDDQRPLWESIQRLRPREREAILKKINEANEPLEKFMRKRAQMFLPP